MKMKKRLKKPTAYLDEPLLIGNENFFSQSLCSALDAISKLHWES